MDTLDLFEEVAAKLQKEGLAYGKMANLVELDMPPKDVPPERLCFAYSAGCYASAAKAIRDCIKKIKKEVVSTETLIPNDIYHVDHYVSKECNCNNCKEALIHYKYLEEKIRHKQKYG